MRRRRLFPRHSNNTTASLPAVTGNAAARGHSAHRISMLLLRPESAHSDGLNTSLVAEPITFNLVGDLVAVFAGTWIAATGAPPNNCTVIKQTT